MLADLLAMKDEGLERPRLNPAIYVEPKDKFDQAETSRQGGWVTHMRKHAPACLVFAVPNGTNIPSKAGRARVKREGLHAGFPDTGCVWADATAYIEWKDGRGDPSDAQILTLNWLHLRGHPVAICRTAAAAVAWLKSIGAPVGVRG